MKKILLPLLLSLSAAAAAAPDATAPTVTVYDGKAQTEAGLTVADWGAGTGAEATDVFLFGGHSLKVTTLDLYQGALVSFAAPVTLPPATGGRVFQVTLRRGAATLHYDPRTLPGAAGTPGRPTAAPSPGTPPPGVSYPGMPPGGFPPGMQAPGGSYPGGSPPYPGGGRRRRRGGAPGATGAAQAPVLIPPVTRLRLAFTLADGRQADAVASIPDASDDTVGEGWYSVNVPLSALRFPAGTGDAALKSVTIGGDHYGVFYIGRMEVTVPPPPAPPAPVPTDTSPDGTTPAGTMPPNGMAMPANGMMPAPPDPGTASQGGDDRRE